MILRLLAGLFVACLTPVVQARLDEPASIHQGFQFDMAGRVVFDPAGGRIVHTSSPPRIGSDPPLPFDPFRAPLGGGSPGGPQISLEWYRAVFGTGIGFAGMEIADIDSDGMVEVVASASSGGFGSNNYWYVLSETSGGYQQEWTSFPYDTELDRLVLAQLDGDAALEILIAVQGHLLIYDGSTRELEADYPTPTGSVYGLAVGNLDADPAIEAALCDSANGWIYDLSTGAQQLPLTGLGCDDIAIGETDGTAGLEIVIAAGTSGYVVDGATGAIEWNHPLGFGNRLAVGDLDGDGMDEIAAGFGWSGIQVWHGDTHGLAWEVSVFNLAALITVDVEGDDSIELVYGDAQWGEVHILDGVNGNEKWFVPNPEHGVTRIAVGDVNDDNDKEILFGAGFTSTGPDHLYVVDSVSHSMEWESLDFSGPFYGLAHGDVDSDNKPELLYTSFESDSGYGDGLYFIHDAQKKTPEYQSPEPTGINWTGLWKIQVANVDGDPALEIFLPTSETYTGVLRCIDGITKAVQWEQQLVSGLTYQSLRLGDPDDDGQLEVVAAAEVQHTGAPGVYVYVYDALTGAPEWQSPNLTSFFGSFPRLDLLRIADVDDDDIGELLVAERGEGLIVLDPVAHTIDLGVSGIEVTALETADLDGDGIPEIVIGNMDGEIESIDPVTGIPTLLAGPFPGAIDGLAIRQILGSDDLDFVFAAADLVHLVDGQTGEVHWTSQDIGNQVGRSDSLLVADIDGDGNLEIWVNAGVIGHFVFEITDRFFGNGFEAGQ